MNFPLFWNESFTAALVNHLWQSTLMVGIAWLVAIALRNNHARVRYWVWFGASVKFLLPFSLLVAAGEWMRSLVAAPVLNKPEVAAAIVKIAQPFSRTEILNAGAAPMATHRANWLPFALPAIWICGILLVAARFARAWWRASAAKRAGAPLALAADVPVLSTPHPTEPGIFGILRPVLLLPEGILERLPAGQLRAIIAHEMCHVRRRDNFTFAVHHLVQTLFWFHPVAWWIGTRLIDERERACDESVVQASGAETYAQGILNICRFYVESPAACVAGVTGADLKKRIVRIMTGQRSRNLSLGRKMLLAALCAIAVAAPVVAGLAWAGQNPAQPQAGDAAHAPQFDVVSIKPHKDEGMMMRIGMRVTPDGFSTDGLPLDNLLRQAFSLTRDRILGEPEWVKSARFDIQAKVTPDDAPKLKDLSRQQRWAMLIPVLQDRCGLKFHHETKELEVYTLVVAKGGPKLKEAAADAPDVTAEPPPSPKSDANGPPPARKGQTMMRMSPQGMALDARSATMEGLIQILSEQTGSTIVDKTGLTGKYDFSLSFMPEDGTGPIGAPRGAPPPDGSGQAQEPVGPSIFTAVQEQLGLKLVPQKQLVDVIVIDHIEQPSAN
ncbi:MAG TPA: M56 family metallopeptidase [Terracidiphilus sp.]|jgi:uncharacterized protein (TIGR03435 family)|nr:M56 family metallopeptidase [Terracidiphilus sp.]